MTFYKIKKRNGAIEDFDRKKIHDAIVNAIKAVGGTEFDKVDTYVLEVLDAVEQELGSSIPEVEMIQDKVEEVLIKHGHDKVAKAFILYRNKRAESRKEKKVAVEVAKSMDEYLHQNDRRVNANANSGYSLGGLILNISGKVTANYWLSHVYPEYIGNHHRNADIHIHDLDMFSGYCAGWSLRQLLEEGFNGLPNRIESEPPKNLQSAVNQMINFLGTLQNERAGAQAFSSFDTYLSPFVHKYEQKLRKDIDNYGISFDSEDSKEKYIQEKTYKYVLQQMQNFIFGLNVPSRWGTQTPFTNITLDWSCPDDLKDKALYLGGYEVGPYEKTYGELEKERKMINKALVEVYIKGDKKGNVFTFPIPTFNIDENFPWDDPELEGVFEMTAKYGIPYFQNFVGSQYRWVEDENGNLKKERNPDAYTPGAVRSMCCRLQLDLTQLEKRGNGLFGSAEMTGSIGVVTLNLARIGYNYKGNKEGFFQQIEALMEVAKTSLEIKRKELKKWLDEGLYPYTKRYLHSFNNHFSTIGINGMNEAILNFTDGESDIATKYGHDFALEVMDFMREKLRQYQEETGNLYNLEATPGEGTTYRFAKEDQKQLPGIIQAGTEEAPYYTNSTQLPVDFTDDAFDALNYQNQLQCKYTGGTVLHLYMGERLSDVQACKSLLKKVIENYQLPYITITPTFSICPKHGYISGEYDFCPKCDAEIGYTGSEFDYQSREIYTSNK
ncbi:ribonucleoside triphosphate reductase [Candidatus Absconditicoccus praedator]|uniref:ribonucleoside triphosphate reductase n=1 Tax=Candidatus Absconditicoccus praedator TaxID=2735562 RepID=UPI001E525362|nr:ribonucleoside triphosphate reductase [Candidatus Absconditicoccus praedator]UFX82732.1 ribonucleoside triphosphate reductase [Candidatus Absconditicoccus praedator]